MGRRPRSFYPGTATHLTARGVDGQPIFVTDFDRFGFLALLRKVTERVEWFVVAWCFMETHYHMLVVAPAEDEHCISQAMQTLNSVYAREFNARHGRRGHLFGERFTDTLVATDRHLRAATAYIYDNPVRAGLVRRSEDWPWSGDGRLEPREHRIVRLPMQSREVLVRSHG